MPQRHLVLTQKQESDLVAFLDKRLADLRKENQERIDADKRSDLDYRNSKNYRALPASVWSHSNMSIPLTSWVVDHFSARTEEEIFGRMPIASFGPEGPADQDLAEGFDRWANYKLFKLGEVHEDLLEAQNTQWTHRAQILKAIYVEDVDEWQENNVPVLHDKTTQQPVQILGHGSIIQGQDKFTPVTDIITGQEVQQLDADPTFKLDPQKHYFAPSPTPIPFRDVAYAGPKSHEVDGDCFHAPPDARTLDDADAIAEYYDKPLHWLQARFIDRPWLNWDQFNNSLAKNNAKRKTEGDRADKAKFARTIADPESATFGIVECWIERDVLGWGKPQRIVVWMERKTNTLVDYEFQKKVTPNGRHPYTAIACWKPHGGKYWWGYSLVEMVRGFQEYVDIQWNRHSFRNSINANPIIAQNPDAIVEKKSFHEMKPYDSVTLEEGKSIEDWLQAFAFPKLDLDTQDLIEKAIYWCNFWLGISNIAQGDYSRWFAEAMPPAATTPPAPPHSGPAA